MSKFILISELKQKIISLIEKNKNDPPESDFRTLPHDWWLIFRPKVLNKNDCQARV